MGAVHFTKVVVQPLDSALPMRKPQKNNPAMSWCLGVALSPGWHSFSNPGITRQFSLENRLKKHNLHVSWCLGADLSVDTATQALAQQSKSWSLRADLSLKWYRYLNPGTENLCHDAWGLIYQSIPPPKPWHRKFMLWCLGAIISRYRHPSPSTEVNVMMFESRFITKVIPLLKTLTQN